MVSRLTHGVRRSLLCLSVIPGLLGVTGSLIAAASAPGQGSAASAPAAPLPGQPDARGFGGAGGGGGRGRRGGAMTAADQAVIAKLAELPAWKPGLGDGDYMMNPPYLPAPETRCGSSS